MAAPPDKAEESALSSVGEHPDGLQVDSQIHSFVMTTSSTSAATAVSSSADPICVQTSFDVYKPASGYLNTFDSQNDSPKAILDSAETFLRSTLETQSRNLSCLMPMPSNELPHSQVTYGLCPDQTSTPESLPSASLHISNGIGQPLPANEVSNASRSPHLFNVSESGSKSTSGISSPASSSESRQSFAETYTSLTSWTTKLSTQGHGQIPSPDKESRPLPFLCTDHTHNMLASSASLYIEQSPPNSVSFPLYSKIGPVSPRDDETVVAEGNYLSEGSSSPVQVSSLLKSKLKSSSNKEYRFKKTADALQKSGLWEVAMKTGNLIKRNRELQKELEQFRADALLFLKSVIKNPQNRDFIKNVLNNVLSNSNAQQRKASVMSVVVSAAAAASMKSRSSTTDDSGIFSSNSCGSQSDKSVSNYSCVSLDTTSPRLSGQTRMEID